MSCCTRSCAPSGSGLRTGSSAAEQPPQLLLGARDVALARSRKVPARAVLVEGQHGHGGAERRRLAPPAPLRRPLERARDLPRALPKDRRLEIQRVARSGDAGGPAPRACPPRSSRDSHEPVSQAVADRDREVRERRFAAARFACDESARRETVVRRSRFSAPRAASLRRWEGAWGFRIP